MTTIEFADSFNKEARYSLCMRLKTSKEAVKWVKSCQRAKSKMQQDRCR